MTKNTFTIYFKYELIDMVRNNPEHKIKISVLNKMSIEELCKLLNLPPKDEQVLTEEQYTARDIRRNKNRIAREAKRWREEEERRKYTQSNDQRQWRQYWDDYFNRQHEHSTHSQPVVSHGLPDLSRCFIMKKYNLVVPSISDINKFSKKDVHAFLMKYHSDKFDPILEKIENKEDRVYISANISEYVNKATARYQMIR